VIENYLVLRFSHGDPEYEYTAEHVWKAHKRVVPNTKGEVVSDPMPLQDAINLARLANAQHDLETQR
jgi:hypothetical protein